MEPLPDVLHGLDSLFLHLERPRTPMHSATIGLFEAAPLCDADGRLRIEELRARTARRLARAPRLRQRARRALLGVAPSTWEDDPRFDIEAHVRQAALPPPGTEEQLLELCAELLSWPLDPRRPLWEMWFLEGVGGGRVAVLEKVHHALADGLSDVALAGLLLDLSPAPPPDDETPWAPEPPMSVGRRLGGALAARATAEARRATAHLATLAHPAAALRDLGAVADGMASLISPSMLAPRSSLNAPIGLHRRLATARASMASVEALAHRTGTTVNDVLLTAVAGGMRDLLAGRGEAPAGLQVLVPVGAPVTRTGRLGNDVSAMVVRLPLDEADPRRLHRAVATVTARAKRHHQARAGSVVVSALDLLSEPMVGMAARLVQHQPFVNVVVTNVPGPPVPLYAMGSRLLEAIPVVPLAGNLSVGVAAVSYDGTLVVGLHADRDRCPDLAVLAAGIDRTFAALLAPRAQPRASGSGAGSRAAPTRRSRAMGAGNHQLARPKSETRAGTSRARTTVASRRMPAPSPVASTLTSVTGAEASEAKARKRMSAALVTRRPVRPTPSITAASVSPRRSYSSRTRVRMKTS